MHTPVDSKRLEIIIFLMKPSQTTRKESNFFHFLQTGIPLGIEVKLPNANFTSISESR